MYTIVHSKPTDTFNNETTNFNSTLLDDGTLFSSHTVNTLIDLKDYGQNNNQKKNNNIVSNDTTNNTNIYQNQQHRQTVNSTELTQNSDPINTTLPKLTNVKTPLPRLQSRNSVHFNTEHFFK